MKIILQSPKVFAPSQSQSLLAATSVSSNQTQQRQITTGLDDNQQDNSNFTPDRIPNWVIFGLSTLIAVVIGSALVFAREGKQSIINYLSEMYKLDNKEKTELNKKLPATLSSKWLGKYIDGGFRSYFNKLVKNMVIENEKHLSNDVRNSIKLIQ